jgi:hypothetical protein
MMRRASEICSVTRNRRIESRDDLSRVVQPLLAAYAPMPANGRRQYLAPSERDCLPANSARSRRTIETLIDRHLGLNNPAWGDFELGAVLELLNWHVVR